MPPALDAPPLRVLNFCGEGGAETATEQRLGAVVPDLLLPPAALAPLKRLASLLLWIRSREATMVSMVGLGLPFLFFIFGF